jgi:chemotaxis protein methyltransferase CheR
MSTLETGVDDFARLAARVRRLCGVDLLQYKRGQMERRVRTFAERRGTPDLTLYAARLQSDPAELDAFLDRVTINVSQLWRHESQWTELERRILPELGGRAGSRLRAWSAGCSYGAEAYSLAATCRETLGERARVEIHGTDLDARMVARARLGAFTAADARTAPRAALARWFEPTPDGGFQAKRELRSMVSFETGDLLRMPIAPRRWSLIMCRNTVIYFTEEVRDALHQRLATALEPGGYLIVGTSERVADPAALGLTSPAPFVYRRA